MHPTFLRLHPALKGKRHMYPWLNYFLKKLFILLSLPSSRVLLLPHHFFFFLKLPEAFGFHSPAFRFFFVTFVLLLPHLSLGLSRKSLTHGHHQPQCICSPSSSSSSAFRCVTTPPWVLTILAKLKVVLLPPRVGIVEVSIVALSSLTSFAAGEVSDQVDP